MIRRGAALAVAVAVLAGGCSSGTSQPGGPGPTTTVSASPQAQPGQPAEGEFLGEYAKALAAGDDATHLTGKGSPAWLYALPVDDQPAGTAIPTDNGARWQLSFADDQAGSQRVLSDPTLRRGRIVDFKRNGTAISHLVRAGDGRWHAGTEFGARGDLRFRINRFANFGDGLSVHVTVANRGAEKGTLLLEKFVTGGKGYGDTTFLDEDVYPGTTVTASLFIPGAPPRAGTLYFSLFADGGSVGSFTVEAPRVGA